MTDKQYKTLNDVKMTKDKDSSHGRIPLDNGLVVSVVYNRYPGEDYKNYKVHVSNAETGRSVVTEHIKHTPREKLPFHASMPFLSFKNAKEVNAYMKDIHHMNKDGIVQGPDISDNLRKLRDDAKTLYKTLDDIKMTKLQPVSQDIGERGHIHFDNGLTLSVLHGPFGGPDKSYHVAVLNGANDFVITDHIRYNAILDSNPQPEPFLSFKTAKEVNDYMRDVQNMDREGFVQGFAFSYAFDKLRRAVINGEKRSDKKSTKAQKKGSNKFLRGMHKENSLC